MSAPIVVSDMDGTLTRAEMWRGVMAWVLEFRPTPAARRFVRVRLPAIALVRLGLSDPTRFRAGWLRDQAGLLRGLSPDELASMGEWVVERHLWPRRREASLAAVAAALAGARRESEAAELLLATGAYQAIGEAFARRIGAAGVLGTPLEMRDGLATGRLAAAAQSGEEKAAAVRARAAGRPIVAAFGDSASDIPLLALARRAVAVAPDAELRREAGRRGWEILEGEPAVTA